MARRANNKFFRILLNAIPVFFMILLIPLIINDYFLTLAYVLIIALSLIINYEKNDYLFLIFGFVIMTLSEYFFISTGVESFSRISLLGVMPLWLPLLWSYAFVAIKRAIIILDNN